MSTKVTTRDQRWVKTRRPLRRVKAKAAKTQILNITIDRRDYDWSRAMANRKQATVSFFVRKQLRLLCRIDRPRLFVAQVQQLLRDVKIMRLLTDASNTLSDHAIQPGLHPGELVTDRSLWGDIFDSAETRGESIRQYVGTAVGDGSPARIPSGRAGASRETYRFPVRVSPRQRKDLEKCCAHVGVSTSFLLTQVIRLFRAAKEIRLFQSQGILNLAVSEGLMQQYLALRDRLRGHPFPPPPAIAIGSRLVQRIVKLAAEHGVHPDEYVRAQIASSR